MSVCLSGGLCECQIDFGIWILAIKDLIERVLEVWTDPKSIKYSLFAWQLCRFALLP